jgi:transcriptional regulator with XRE-family HTH domain
MAEREQDRLATIGGRMRAVRLARGMTAGDIAEQLHVSRPTITTWETDKVEKIDKDKLVDFAKLADVSLKWLMAGTGKKPDLNLDIHDRAFVGKRFRDGTISVAAATKQEAIELGDLMKLMNVDPMVRGLLSHLPTGGSVWPKADRKRWLALLEGSFDLIYKENEP